MMMMMMMMMMHRMAPVRSVEKHYRYYDFMSKLMPTTKKKMTKP